MVQRRFKKQTLATKIEYRQAGRRLSFSNELNNSQPLLQKDRWQSELADTNSVRLFWSNLSEMATIARHLGVRSLQFYAWEGISIQKNYGCLAHSMGN